MRKAFVGITDRKWFESLSARPDLTEINFWQPHGRTRFRALERGDLFLFKLHAPDNYIVGGGFFEASSLLPVSLAWETFGQSNGVGSLAEMRKRIEHYRREPPRPQDDYTIGNIILQQPFFLYREAWIPSPTDFAQAIVRGKTYDLDSGTGYELAAALQACFATDGRISAQRAMQEGVARRMFSDPVLARHRLGQGGFRLLVTESYDRQCAVTREHTLPVLEAAHIRPVTQGGQHQMSNGLLLRSDVHTLFDRGYVTVTPDYRFRVSPRLNQDWQNGKVYFALDNQPIHVPKQTVAQPDRDLLAWHSEEVFLK